MRLAGLLRQPAALVLGTVLIAALWLLTGRLGEPDQPPAPPPAPPQAVAVEIAQPRLIQRELSLQGQLLPERTVTVRAETAGQIIALEVERGQSLTEGATLIRIAPGDREARLRQVEADLARARRDLQGSEQLAEDGFRSALEVDAARAAVRAAEAARAAIATDLDKTVIRAPIDGLFESQHVDVGEWVGVGGALLDLVDNDPLIAQVRVPQHRIASVRTGVTAQVLPVGAEVPIPGRVRYVSRVADAATRSFELQVEIDNPDGRLPAGTSASVVLPIADVMAQRVSPAMLKLDDSGQAGVALVDDSSRVVFQPVTVVRSDQDGLWVTGVPDGARMISAGAGLVSTGQSVRIVERSEARP